MRFCTAIAGLALLPLAAAQSNVVTGIDGCAQLETCVNPATGNSGNCFNPNHWGCCPDGTLVATYPFSLDEPGYPTTCPGRNSYFVTWNATTTAPTTAPATTAAVAATTAAATTVVTTASPTNADPGPLPPMSPISTHTVYDTFGLCPYPTEICLTPDGSTGNCVPGATHFYCCDDGSYAAFPDFAQDDPSLGVPTTCPGVYGTRVRFNATTTAPSTTPAATTSAATSSSTTSAPTTTSSATPASTTQAPTSVTTCPSDAASVCNVVGSSSESKVAYCYSATQYTCNKQATPYLGDFLCPVTAPDQCGTACYSALTSGMACQVSTSDPYGSSQLVSNSSVILPVSTTTPSTGSGASTYTLTFTSPTSSSLEYVIVHSTSSQLDDGVPQNVYLTSTSSGTYSTTLEIPVGSTIEYSFTYAVSGGVQSDSAVSTATVGPVSTGGSTSYRLVTANKAQQSPAATTVYAASLMTLLGAGVTMMMM